MYQGPRLKSAPFTPFSKAFLPESMLRKAGFIKSNDMPYERNKAVRSTHQEFFKITQESMFGAPSDKIMRLDSLRESFTISETEKGRGLCMFFADVKTITTGSVDACRLTISPKDPKGHEVTFRMETPEVASSFAQRLETLVQAKKMGENHSV